MTTTTDVPDLVPETRFGSPLIDVSVDWSQETADWFNRRAAIAADLTDGEWVELTPGKHLALAVPTAHVPRAGFLELHDRLQLSIDGGALVLDLKDFPRFFSFAPFNRETYRHGPTWFPYSVFPEDWIGTYHEIELLSDGRSLFGPERRFIGSPDQGAVYETFVGGEGKLVAEVSNLAGLHAHREAQFPAWVAIFTDPVFGVPTTATLIDAAGERHALQYEHIATDYVGDQALFHEAVMWGIEPAGDRVTIELEVPETGTGLAVMLAAGHTLPGANQPAATVS